METTIKIQYSSSDLVTPKVIECMLLTPAFFSRKMNISGDVLSNYFSIWKTALSDLLNKNIINHDALVGENACHIRALALLDIIMESEKKTVRNVLDNIIEEIQLIIEIIPNIPITHEDTQRNISEFMIKHHLVFSIPATLFNQIKFIIEAYLLTLTKESLPTTGLSLRERTNFHHLDVYGLSKNKTKVLITNTQKSLSKASCDYLKAEATSIKNKAILSLLKIKYDAHERSFLPQFFAAKVVFQKALQKNYYIFLKVTRYIQYGVFDQINLCFRANKDQTDFEPCINVSKNRPCIVIAGTINYEQLPETQEDYLSRLTIHSLIELLHANFAIHPQYSGELKELAPPFIEVIEEIKNQINQLKPLNGYEKQLNSLHECISLILIEKEDFEKKKNFAITKGCSLENPSLLFLNHVYCDMLENHLSLEDYQVTTKKNEIVNFNNHTK